MFTQITNISDKANMYPSMKKYSGGEDLYQTQHDQ